jgi:hypothetical protein
MKRAAEKRQRNDETVLTSRRAVVPGAEAKNASSTLQSESTVRIQGFVVTDHSLTVPLDHFNGAKAGPTIQIFAREVSSRCLKSRWWQ